MDDAARPGCSEKDDAGTGTGTMGHIDGLERAKSKIDITIPNKTNKTLILVSY